MNDQPHTHQIKYHSDLGGMIEYGDQHAYLHLMKDGEPPGWWPRWYLNWKTKRIIRRLIQRHDEGSLAEIPTKPATKIGAVRSLVSEAQTAIEHRSD